ncbi:MAG: LysR family transcriptional regulator [Phascolarctobacterium sp.]|nr:LysR family transcriptional regulator [Phascolarctobacterium sp.]
MNLDFYKNFIVVAQIGNITEAANKLNLVQPALSKQLTALENYYGAKFIEKQRGKRQIILTDAGMDFLRRAKEICQAEESIALDLECYKAGAGGSLRLSISQAAVNSFMDKYLLPFARLYPNISYQIREEAVAEQITSLKHDHIDLAYANAPLPEAASYNYLTLEYEPFYAVYHVSNTFGFNPDAPITLQDLADKPICCNYGCFTLLSTLCTACGFTPDVRLIATTGGAAVKFAACGNVIAVVSKACCQDLPPSLRLALIEEKQLAFNQTLFWSKQKQPSPQAQQFISFVTTKEKQNIIR